MVIYEEAVEASLEQTNVFFLIWDNFFSGQRKGSTFLVLVHSLDLDPWFLQEAHYRGLWN